MLKKAFHSCLSFVLAFAIFFSSSGVVIASHICYSSKKSDVSLFEREKCCKSTCNDNMESMPNSETFGKKCCDLSVSVHKLHINGFQKTEPVVFDVYTLDHPDLTAIIYLPIEKNLPVISDSDPPPGGTQLLYSIHQLLI